METYLQGEPVAVALACVGLPASLLLVVLGKRFFLCLYLFQSHSYICLSVCLSFFFSEAGHEDD